MDRTIILGLVFFLTRFSVGQKSTTILETPLQLYVVRVLADALPGAPVTALQYLWDHTWAEYIKPCAKNDPNINTCLMGTFNHLRPYLITGIQDIDVPSMDPMIIPRMTMENGDGPFRIKAAFTDIIAHGGSNYSIKSIKADVENYTIEVAMKLPKIDVRGKYDVGGNVLLLPIRSKGDYWAVFVNVDVIVKLHGKEITKSDQLKYMIIDKMAVNFTIHKSRFRVRDVVNHGNVIGEALNQFLNANSKEIIQEMKPAAVETIARYFTKFMNNALLRLPMQVWLPDT